VLACRRSGLIQARTRGTAEVRVSNRETNGHDHRCTWPSPTRRTTGSRPDAGQDLVVGPETMVRLSAAGSQDPDGDELRYRWSQLKGPYVFLWDADTATPHFVSPKISTEAVIELSLVSRMPKARRASP
jgi:hypothetical protein